jgi:VanZ family protein
VSTEGSPILTRPRLLHRRAEGLRRLAFAGWCATWLVLAWLMLHPAPPQVAGVSDKLAHFLSFALISFATITFCRNLRQFLLAGGFCAFAGVALEAAQGFTATRVFEWADMVANLAGMATGITTAALLLLLLQGRWYRQRRAPAARHDAGRPA